MHELGGPISNARTRVEQLKDSLQEIADDKSAIKILNKMSQRLDLALIRTKGLCDYFDLVAHGIKQGRALWLKIF
jgi:hypothetical protein